MIYRHNYRVRWNTKEMKHLSVGETATESWRKVLFVWWMASFFKYFLKGLLKICFTLSEMAPDWWNILCVWWYHQRQMMVIPIHLVKPPEKDDGHSYTFGETTRERWWSFLYIWWNHQREMTESGQCVFGSYMCVNCNVLGLV